jgi:hypothetical protein
MMAQKHKKSNSWILSTLIENFLKNWVIIEKRAAAFGCSFSILRAYRNGK